MNPTPELRVIGDWSSFGGSKFDYLIEELKDQELGGMLQVKLDRRYNKREDAASTKSLIRNSKEYVGENVIDYS